MDLEWNYAAVSPEDLIAGKTLRFEIIQIGAAMVDSRGRILKTFDRLIAPTVHHTIMPKVTELTGITEQKLRGQQTFPSVWQEFVCGAAASRKSPFGETATGQFCCPTCCTSTSPAETALSCTTFRRCSTAPISTAVSRPHSAARCPLCA